MRAAGDAAGSLSLRRPLRRREGGGTSGLFARWVCGRVRVEGDAAEAVAVVSRRNKFLRAPFAVRRGFCLRLGASGVGDPRILSRSRAMVDGGPSALAVWVLRWAMDAGRRRPFFFLVGMICCCCSSPSSALMLVGDPALSGRMARPRCWTGRMTRVLFLPEGTLFAVLKAKDGDGCCRCVGLMSMPSQRWCQERRKQRGGNCTVVEDDDLFATGCRSFCCRGLLSRFRDDDTGLRRSSCVMVVLGYSRCSWSFVFAFQCACKGQLLCTES